MSRQRCLLLFLAVVLISGCATKPPGPSVMVLPASGKSFDSFSADDLSCRQWAESQTGWKANETTNQNLLSGSGIGALLGAGLGGAIGSTSGHFGSGAAIGAAAGMIGGLAASSNQANVAGNEVQRRYDIAYQQCMYSKGNQIPGIETKYRRYAPPPPPPQGYIPGESSRPPAYPPPPPSIKP